MSERDPVNVVLDVICGEYPLSRYKRDTWRSTVSTILDAVRVAGLLRDEAEIAAREQAAYERGERAGYEDAGCGEAARKVREQALREAAAVAKVAWLSFPRDEPGDADAEHDLCAHAKDAILALLDKEAAP